MLGGRLVARDDTEPQSLRRGLPRITHTELSQPRASPRAWRYGEAEVISEAMWSSIVSRATSSGVVSRRIWVSRSPPWSGRATAVPECFTKYENFALTRSARGVLTIASHADGHHAVEDGSWPR